MLSMHPLRASRAPCLPLLIQILPDFSLYGARRSFPPGLSFSRMVTATHRVVGQGGCIGIAAERSAAHGSFLAS